MATFSSKMSRERARRSSREPLHAPSPSTRTGRRGRRTSSRSTSRARACTRVAAFASLQVPCSRTSSSSTRSTGRRRGRSRRCSRRCRSARSRSRERPARCPIPFIVLATQNPIEFEGTFALPQAQLDRFLLRVRIGYPDEPAERTIARRYQVAAEPLDAIRPVMDGPGLIELRDEVRRMRVADEIEAYGVAVVRATRAPPRPPARRAARGRASPCTGRPRRRPSLPVAASSCPTTSRPMAEPVLGHRLVVDLDRSLRGASADAPSPRSWRRCQSRSSAKPDAPSAAPHGRRASPRSCS